MAVGAVLLMLPALGAGLFMDDLVQRVMQLRPEELPPQMQQTGFGPQDSGRLGTVLCDLFGLSRSEEASALVRDYGLPWWMPDNFKAALWRPLTAFTHWSDYRIFPNTPWLMHAHSIAWFAFAVLLAAITYRRICEHEQTSDGPRSPGLAWVPGLAALLFLLDKNSYFPVMFVANRGFIVALCFGLLCLIEHHRWRTTNSPLHLTGSMLALAFSMLANEGGASTLAFLVSYALVLENRGWRGRVLSLVPAAVVMAVWRTVYVSMGFGVANLGGYIDPGYEPLLFAGQVVQRVILLLGGQFSGISPEVVLVLSPGWQVLAGALFLVFCLAGSMALLPVVREDRAARFWFFSMLLALIPAATVVPLSKNMGFVAVGAFGAIAALLARVLSVKPGSSDSAPAGWALRLAAILLIIAHVPGALAARTALAMATPHIEPASRRACGFPRFPEIGERDVVVVNNPCLLTTLATPFVRAYYSEPVPASMRTLLPANTGFRLRRTSERTLVVEADRSTASGDLMSCDDLGPAHPCYAIQGMNNILPGPDAFESGMRVTRKGFVAEIVETSASGALRQVAFHFDQPLESAQLVWLWFDWSTWKYQRFAIPRIGESVSIAGPSLKGR